MKVRNGFVSNSSTTSFCLYGVRLESDILQKFRDEDDDGEDVYNSMIARLTAARDKPNLRIQVEDKESHQLQNRVPDSFLKVWKRNECDKTAIEDWFIVRR